jgi:hypothetical protein
LILDLSSAFSPILRLLPEPSAPDKAPTLAAAARRS